MIEDADDSFPDLKALLLAMPDVGDDAIFERLRDMPREIDLDGLADCEGEPVGS